MRNPRMRRHCRCRCRRRCCCRCRSVGAVSDALAKQAKPAKEPGKQPGRQAVKPCSAVVSISPHTHTHTDTPEQVVVAAAVVRCCCVQLCGLQPSRTRNVCSLTSGCQLAQQVAAAATATSAAASAAATSAAASAAGSAWQSIIICTGQQSNHLKSYAFKLSAKSAELGLKRNCN